MKGKKQRKAERILNAFARSAVKIYMHETKITEAAEWLRLYSGKQKRGGDAFGQDSRVASASLELPSAICAEFARLVAAEAEFKFIPSDNEHLKGFDGGRAEFLNNSLSPFFAQFKNISELAFASGGIMLKPVFYGRKKISVEVFLPGDFEIISLDGADISAVDFISRCNRRGSLFIRRERHERTDSGWQISNIFYRASDSFGSAREISQSHAATEVAEWGKLANSVTIAKLSCPLFAYYRVGTREGSPYGLSVFARAVDLIKEADKQFGRLLWEFEGGELAIDASEDAFRLDRFGKPVLPSGRERLFRPNKLDYTYGSSTDPLRTFSPALRDASIVNGLNQIIMRIEDVVGLARGTFSDPQQTARTATEIKMMRQRTYAAVRDLQSGARFAMAELSNAADAVCTLYRLAPPGEIKLVCEFGDSVLSDSESERALDLEEVKAGVMDFDLYSAKWHNGIVNRKDKAV